MVLYSAIEGEVRKTNVAVKDYFGTIFYVQRVFWVKNNFVAIKEDTLIQQLEWIRNGKILGLLGEISNSK